MSYLWKNYTGAYPTGIKFTFTNNSHYGSLMSAPMFFFWRQHTGIRFLTGGYSLVTPFFTIYNLISKLFYCFGYFVIALCYFVLSFFLLWVLTLSLCLTFLAIFKLVCYICGSCNVYFSYFKTASNNFY